MTYTKYKDIPNRREPLGGRDHIQHMETSLSRVVPGPGEVIVGGPSGPVAVAHGSGTASGPRVAVIGDSIARAGSDPDGTPYVYLNGASDLILYASLQSDSAFYPVRNFGVNGENAAQVRARLESALDSMDVLPDALWIYCGTNGNPEDLFDATREDIAAMVEMTRARGVMPILGTLVPGDGRDSTHRTAVDTYNKWLMVWGAQNRVPVIDVYAAAVDPATGNWKAGWSNDGLHPNPTAGGAGIGRLIADDLAALFPRSTPPLHASVNQGANLIPNGCMIGGTALATGWSGGGNNQGTVTYSLVEDDEIVGRWQRVEVAGAAGGSYEVRTTSQIPVGAATFAPGDRLILAGKIRATLPGSYITVRMEFTGGTPSRVYLSPNLQVDEIPTATFMMEMTVPEGTTQGRPLIGIPPREGIGEGTVDFGQMTLLNLTKLGLA